MRLLKISLGYGMNASAITIYVWVYIYVIDHIYINSCRSNLLTQIHIEILTQIHK